ncbi:MAG: lipopolysaccharide heptosyltransferase II [Deltaproteobacteria bacterium]|nr:lipopolysaccharide heptosyltransferase II [Deltaproteobacteria bacterium]
MLSLPALLAVRLGWEGELLLLARGAGAALYRLFPGADEILEDRRGFAARLGLARVLRERRVSAALLWQHAFGAALTARLAGIPRRVGYARHGRSPLLTLAVRQGPEDLASHQVFGHLRLVSELGLPAPFSLPRLPVPALDAPGVAAASRRPGPASLGGPASPEDARAAASLLGDGGFLLALAPGASYGSAKRWPAASFAAAARMLLEGRRGARAVVLGGRGELAACEDTARGLAGGPPCLNLAGRTSLGECAAVLARADLALTNDSGLMHLACAVGTPVAAPFGPTDPVATGPLGARAAVIRTPAPCAPCLRRECRLPERICFARATPRAVAEAAERLLEPPRTPLPPSFRAASPAAFVCAPPGGPFLAPAGLPVILAFPERLRGAPFLGPPPPSPASRPAAADAPVPGGGAPVAPGASLEGRGVYFVPEGNPVRFLRDLALALGADPARSIWLADSMEALAPAASLGGRSALWLGKGAGLPQEVLEGGRLPGIVAPGFQGALDWAGASR